MFSENNKGGIEYSYDVSIKRMAYQKNNVKMSENVGTFNSKTMSIALNPGKNLNDAAATTFYRVAVVLVSK